MRIPRPDSDNTASLSVVSKAVMQATELRYNEDGTTTHIVELRAEQ
jgi:hypothetical protein